MHLGEKVTGGGGDGECVLQSNAGQAHRVVVVVYLTGRCRCYQSWGLRHPQRSR